MLVPALKRFSLFVILVFASMSVCMAQTKIDLSRDVKNYGAINQAINPLDYGAKYDVKFCFGNATTAAITAASDIVQCDTANFTSADVGKVINATNGCCGIGIGVGTKRFPYGTTVASIIDTTHVHISAAATGSCTTTCAIAWGTDDTTAIANAWTAVVNQPSCGSYMHPRGFAFTKTGQFNSSNPQCATTNIDALGGASVWGQGTTASGLVPTSDFDFSTCTAGTHHACFGHGVQQVHDWEIFGLFDSHAGETHNNIVIFGMPFVSGNSFVDRFAVLEFDGDDSGTNNFGFEINAFCNHTYSIGAGAISCVLYNTSNITSFTDGGCGNTKDNSLYITNSAIMRSARSSFGQTLAAWTIRNSGTWYSTDDFVWTSAAGGNPAMITLDGGISYIDGMLAMDPSANHTALLVTNSSVVHLSNSRLQGGTGGYALYTVSGTSVFDLGGTTLTGPLNVTAGTLFGSASITGTMQTAANIALTSGWDTSTKSAIAGDSHREIFTITAAGTPGPSPVITVTFPTPFWVAPASCTITQTGGTFATLTNPAMSGLSATSVTITFVGTPVATQVYTYDLTCGP